MVENVRVWLAKQGEAAKFAWTIILVIFGMFGYAVVKDPSVTQATNIQSSTEARLDLIEKELKNDPNVQKDLSAKILDLEGKIKALEQLLPNIQFVPSAQKTNNPTGLLSVPTKNGGYNLVPPVVK